MPKKAEHRIGKVYGRWLVVAENHRSIGYDHGKQRLKTRNFKVECVKCGYIKESVSYKNIYYDHISHEGCENEWEKEHNGYLNGKLGYNLVGKIITSLKQIKHTVLNVTIPPKGKYTFRTLLYQVECCDCKKRKNVIHQQVSNRDFNICKCWKKIETKKHTKKQIVEMIDDEFTWMLELNKEGQLINYLMNKFPEENWEEIMKEED